MYNKSNKTFLAASVFMLVLSLTGSAWGQGAGGSDAPQIKTKEGIGNYLTDGKGLTLYYFKKDTPGRSACTGPCLEKWPVYYAEKLKAPAGSDPKNFGEFTREDGKKQSTFKNWPLYHFSGDKNPGDTNGQGAKDAWYVINPITIEPCL